VAQVACDEYKELLMGYLDDELNEEQKQKLNQHLTRCKQCTEELEEFKKLKAITDQVTLVEPEDRLWQDYWSGVYNRIERNIGWILLSVAGILLVISGGFKLIEEIVNDPAVGIVLKIGLLVLIVGIAVLFVSIVRERLFFWKSDRYKDIRR
jgi:predicted anti-sigma-YlaC factor YlaD